MDKIPLDRQTADRLLAGTLDPDDAPPGWARVASLLQAAAGPVDPVGFPHDESTVAAMVTELTERSPASGGVGSRPGSRRSRWWRAKLVAVAVGCTLVATTGLAFAGALPAPAQDAVSTVLAKIGISVPRHNAPAGPEVPGPSLNGLCQASDSGQGGTHGNRDDAVPFQNLQGGAGDLCSTATPGNAGGNGNAPGQGKHGPAVPTPNVGGSGTGNDTSGDASSNGSGNAPSHPRSSADD